MKLSKRYKQIRFAYRYWKARINPPKSEIKFRKRLGWRYWWYGFRHQYCEWIVINHRLKRIRLDFAVFFHGRKIDFEIDGRQHEQMVVDDWARDIALKDRGWEVVRIKTNQLDDKDLVARVIHLIRH